MDYKTYPDQAKTWIYQASRPFTFDEQALLKKEIDQFLIGWTAHNYQLKATGDILQNQFIVLMVDETTAGASGCSIDKSVHFLKSLEKKLGVSLFNRTLMGFLIEERVVLLTMDQFKDAGSKGQITGETLFFDNRVTTKRDLDQKWLVPVKSTPLSQYVSLPTQSSEK